MFKVGDIVECVDSWRSIYLETGFKYEVIKLPTNKEYIWVKTRHGEQIYKYSRFKLASPKHYFVNIQDFLDNRTLMAEEEAMEYLRKNGGGTLYKKVLTMRIKTKTVEEIEKHG